MESFKKGGRIIRKRVPSRNLTLMLNKRESQILASKKNQRKKIFVQRLVQMNRKLPIMHLKVFMLKTLHFSLPSQHLYL